MNRREFLGALAGLGVAAGWGSAARAAQWELLGSRNVNWKVERDTITAAFQGAFRAIQLKVKGNDLFLHDVKVIYGNGNPDDIPVRALIPQGGATRVIDLRGGRRFIRAVTMVYQKPVNGGGPTFVEVWGRR